MVQEDTFQEDGGMDALGNGEMASSENGGASSDETQHPHGMASPPPPPPHLPSLTIQRPSNGGGEHQDARAIGRASAAPDDPFSPAWGFSRAGGQQTQPSPLATSPSHRSGSPGPLSSGSGSPGGGSYAGSRSNSPRRPDAGSGLSFPPSSSFPFAHSDSPSSGMASAPPLSRSPAHLSDAQGYGDASSSGRVSPAAGPPGGRGISALAQVASDVDEERDRFPPRQLPQFDFNQRRHSLANGEASFQAFSPKAHFQQARPSPHLHPHQSLQIDSSFGPPPPPGAWSQAALKRKMSHDRSMMPLSSPYPDTADSSQGTESPTSAGGSHTFPADFAMAEGGPTKRRGSAFDSKMTSLSLTERMSAQGSPLWGDNRRDSVASIRSNTSYQSSAGGYGTGTSQTSYTGGGPGSGSEMGAPKSYQSGLPQIGWQPQQHQPQASGMPHPAPPSGYYPGPQSYQPSNVQYAPPYGSSYPPPPHAHDAHPGSHFENYSMGGGGGESVRSSVASASTTVPGNQHSRSQSPTSSSGSPRMPIAAIDQQDGQQHPYAGTKAEPSGGRSRANSVSSSDKKGGKGGLLAPPEGETPYSRSPELRVSHKLAERKRRKEMKELFDELRDQLPAERGTKSSKWEILSKAVDHITALKEASAGKDREIERMRRELDALRYPSGSYAAVPAAPPPVSVSVPPTAYAHPYPHTQVQPQQQLPQQQQPLQHQQPPPLDANVQRHQVGPDPYAMPPHQAAVHHHHPQHQHHAHLQHQQHQQQQQQQQHHHHHQQQPSGYTMQPPHGGGYHPMSGGPPLHSSQNNLPPLQQSGVRQGYAPHHPSSRPIAQDGPHHPQ